MYRLFHTPRSSSSWRARIALALKNAEYESVVIDLAGGPASPARAPVAAVNPMAQVPVLEWDDGVTARRLSQSMAIVTWLDAALPDPPLFPRDPLLRATAVQLAEVINAGTQPLQNSAVLGRLQEAGVDSKAWARDYIERGLLAYEVLARDVGGRFSVGDSVSVADAYLVPQMANARAIGADLEPMPTVRSIEAACLELDAFSATAPGRAQ